MDDAIPLSMGMLRLGGGTVLILLAVAYALLARTIHASLSKADAESRKNAPPSSPSESDSANTNDTDEPPHSRFARLDLLLTSLLITTVIVGGATIILAMGGWLG